MTATVFDRPLDIVSSAHYDEVMGEASMIACEIWAEMGPDGQVIPAFFPVYRFEKNRPVGFEPDSTEWGKAKWGDVFGVWHWPEINRKVRRAIRKHFPKK